MAKPLSEQLADLSISAKKAEDAVAAARKEAQDKVIARREQAHAAAAAAIQAARCVIAQPSSPRRSARASAYIGDRSRDRGA